MSENTLIAVNTGDKANENALAVSTAGNFLPRIKQYQGNAKEIAKKKIAAGGNFGLVRSKEDLDDLGSEVIIIPIVGRSKALDISGDMIITNFEPKSPEFAAIQEGAKVKNSGRMWGPEFLCWLPQQEQFATLFFASPTARRQGGEVLKRLGKGTILYGEFIENDKFSWWGPLVKDCVSPPEALPGPTEAQEQVDKYLSEKSSQVKAADSPDADERER